MYCRIYCVNLPGSIDRELDSIDRSLCKLFFSRIFQLSPSQFDVLGFMFFLKYKRKNPSHVLCCCLCYVCESLVRSRGVPSHILRVIKNQDYVKNKMISSVAA